MELNWLRHFYEVARVQSVTQAGRHLQVSQPAVTKSVRLLEQHLGYKLFVKVGRNIRLSSEGQRLFEHCVPLFKKVEQIRNLGQALNQDWRGQIRLGASDNLCNYVIPGVIRGISKRVPHADWMVYSGSSKEIKQKLIAGEIDFGLFYTELSLSDQMLLRQETIADVPFVAVCGPTVSRTLSLERLRKLKLTYVGVRFADYAHTLPEQWLVKTLGIRYDRSVQANSKETQKQIVLAGTGFGIFPRFMVQEELRLKKLTLISGSERPISLRAVHRIGESLTVAAKAVIQELKNSL